MCWLFWWLGERVKEEASCFVIDDDDVVVVVIVLLCALYCFPDTSRKRDCCVW